MLPSAQQTILTVRYHLLRITGVRWKINQQESIAWYEATVAENSFLKQIKSYFHEHNIILLLQRNQQTKAPVLVYKPYELALLAQIPPLVSEVPKRVPQDKEAIIPVDALYASHVSMIDLHGLSKEQAKNKVIEQLLNADFHQKIFRIVTGVGNHVNSLGERGTLYKEFPKWIKEAGMDDKIESVVPGYGYYEVTLKTEQTIKPTVTELLSLPALQPLKAEMNINFEQKRALAIQGAAEAQCTLGMCYEHGYFVKKNPKTAAKWYRAAAEQGHDFAQTQLGALYWIGNGVRQNDTEAIKWLSKAAQQENSFALFNLGKFYLAGTHVKQDKKRAFDYFQKAASVGHTEAKRLVSYCYFKGEGVNSNQQLAFEWCQEAANEGDLSSQFNMGYYYEEGIGVEKDLSKAFRYYEMAALRGDYDGQFALGRCYVLGIGTIKDQPQGEEWLEKAASNGHTNANMLLFQTNHRLEHLKNAAAGGSLLAKLLSSVQEKDNLEKVIKETSSAPLSQLRELPIELQFMIANHFLYEEGTKKRVQKALALLTPLANHGNLDAIRKLALFYTKSPLYKENSHQRVLGIQYYERGSQQQDAFCLTNLGIFYKNGAMGLKENSCKSLDYLKQAAAQHCPIAHHELGMFYLGYYPTPDFLKAYDHFQRAAKGCELISETASALSFEERLFRQQTLPNAAYHWGRICFLGAPGIEADREQGILWLKKASEQDHLRATEMLVIYFSACEAIDIEEKYLFCNRAIQLGSENQFVLFELGQLYSDKNSRFCSLQKALHYYQKAEIAIKSQAEASPFAEAELRMLQHIEHMKSAFSQAVSIVIDFFTSQTSRVASEEEANFLQNREHIYKR